ncbi:MAG: BlaI/MecI/CopY family transcriptional regulator [Mycobacteriales bacterium]
MVQRLGELERAVMDALWERERPATVREIAEDLADRHLAYTTVQTVLNRLAGKDLARRGQDGRTWRYTAAAGRDAYVAELMLEALQLTGDRRAALTHFARAITQPDVAALRHALPNAENPPRRKRS